MPIYEYVCQDCQTRFEALRLMKDADTPIACQECQSERTKRCLTVFNAVSGGKTIAAGKPACSGCAGGACSSCG
jgi:putative FmdB family regulatory protein